MKKNVLIVAVVIAGVILALGYWSWQKKSATVLPSASPTVSPTPQGTPESPVLEETKEYQAVLKIYGASGYRFQFTDCHVAPIPSSTLVIKSGLKFMLDNRDSTVHKFTVNTQTYTVGAYDFVIVAAPKAVGTYPISCDGIEDGKLTVQR